MDIHRPFLPLMCILMIPFCFQLVSGGLVWVHQGLITPSIKEDSPKGTVITSNGLTGANDIDVISDNSNCYVNITSKQQQSVNFTVSLNTNLDFDYGQHHLQCSITGSSADGQSQHLTINIIVVDVNDLTPELKNQPYTVSVPENAGKDTIVYSQIQAEDRDQSDQVFYSLSTTDEDVFKITDNGSLILKEELDFETVRFYHYIVTVKDKVGHNVSADVFITVEDVQDTQPYFTGEPFQTQISEAETPGATLLTIRAADGDRGRSNNITLNITKETCAGLFEIHPQSGALKLKSTADRDKGDVYKNNGICTLNVQATEGKQYPQVTGNDTAITSVTITILDVNDNAPRFSNTSYNVQVDENTQEGVPINLNTPITVIDDDQGVNADFEVHITNNLTDYFDVTPPRIQSTAEILIRVKNSTILDYETVQTLTLELEAVDMNRLVNKIIVTIHINNINDNSPVFSNSTFYAGVVENSKPDIYVTTITATDADKQDSFHNYGRITYRLQQSDSSFKINSSSGHVLVDNGTLDREIKNVYYLTVIAEDGGHIKTTALLEITIIDENDESPLFVAKDYQTSLKELEMTFIQPITVHATDKDEPNSPNSNINYTIISTLPPGLESYFGLDSSSGTLTVKKTLEFDKLKFSPEEIGNITLIVEAKDNGSPPRSSHVSVYVNLQDINNYHPLCSKPQYRENIPENSAKSSPVIQVNATDGDGMAPNNVFMFSIDQDSAGKFMINSSTGLLSLRDKLDREEQSQYTITVTVTDFGVPANSNSCIVSVDVSDINDVPPEFFRKTKTAHVDENTLELSVNMSAYDQDLDDKLVYKIIWEQCTALDPEGHDVDISILKNWTAIDNETGIIFNIGKMDRETIESFTLAVQVEDINSQTELQVDNGTVTVYVLDKNDMKPEFSQKLYQGQIQENMPDGSEFHLLDLLSVTDEDKDENSEFTLSILSPGNVFSVDPSDGKGKSQFSLIVQNTSALDFEEHPYLIFQIVATESKTSDNFNSTATVNITILNTNDNMPEFKNATFSASVSEDAPNGTSFTTIEATDADKFPYGTVTYTFPNNPPEFTINETTGEVFTKVLLNREQQEIYTVSVRAADTGSFATTTQLTITVRDVNDNYPHFLQNQTSVTIAENELYFSPPLLVEATDADAPGNNSQIKYSLQSIPANLQTNFTIDPLKSEITLVEPLDYERLDPKLSGVIYLIVTAEDLGENPQSSTTSVTINVKDMNDISPQFTKPTFVAYVSENTSTGNTVFNVTAVDEDISTNNHELSYLIDTLSGSIFNINPDSGEITLKIKLDFEQVQEYNITVTALDHGIPVQTSTAIINVKVTDINDENPQFVKKQTSTASEENTGFQHICAAFDVDSSRKLEYRIQWNASSGQDAYGAFVSIKELQSWFDIDPKNGTVKSLKDLDREQISKFVLQVLVEDIGAEDPKPQTDTATLTITVNDVNDKPPVFSLSFYNASIRENMPDKSDIEFKEESLEVYDADEQESNNHFNLFLLTYNTTFSINPASGNSKQTFTISILDSSVLDYEINKNFTLEVLAIDVKTPSMNSSATIFVNIINENDNIPEFLGGPYRAAVSENSYELTKVIVVNATDLDDGIYGIVTYSLDDPTNKFGIDNKSGEVYLLAYGLDRENISEYTVKLIATDNGGFRATTQLLIEVSDLNDQPPVFSSDSYPLIFNEGITIILPEFYVLATDKDDPKSDNSRIKYSLLNYTSFPQSSFSIDGDSGKLTLKSPLDYESLSGPFILTVLASDQGLIPNVVNVSVDVIVLDVNDNAPVFKNNASSARIYENVTVGFSVITVRATDNDRNSSNNQVTYTLDTLSAKTFSIHQNGTITVIDKSNIDREQTPGYTIIVTATDNGQPALTSTASVNVTVLDVNDSPPTFSWDSLSVTRKENTAGVITQNNATDPDIDSNLHYSILWSESTGMDGNGLFMSGDSLQGLVAINNSTGEVYPVNKLDRERLQRFQLTLVVEDKNNVPNTKNNDTAILTVTVEDEDDSSPTFNGNDLSATIQENMPQGSEIKMINVSALIVTDADTGDNSMYNITLEDNSVFIISPSQGKGSTTCTITVANSSVLDYEQYQNFTIKVLATDKMNPSMYNSTTIHVNIINENDNIPEFIGGPYTEYVLEGRNINHTVTFVKATDKDYGSYGEVTYSLDDTSHTFGINNKSGEVYLLTNELDRENVSEYTVKLIATDNGGFRATTQLIIEVSDFNDEPPVFSQNNYTLSFDEGITIIMPEFYVLAADKDDPKSDNSRIKYSLLNNTSFPQSSFSIDGDSGKLTLISLLDYESLSGPFILTVLASDQGLFPNVVNVSVEVIVLDVNDNAPVFKNNASAARIYENVTVGFSVITVSATDNDRNSSNNQVTYTLDTLSAKTFSIHQNGTITVIDKSNIDREQIPGYTIIVTATDNGKPALISTASVNVTVLDVNDSPPTFSWDSRSVTREENTAAVIAQNNATDPDIDCNLYYSILWSESTGMDGNGRFMPGDSLQALVTINNSTGEVYPVNWLDREQLQRFQLTLVVEDKNNVPNTKNNDTAMLTVIIEDIDDSSPNFNGDDLMATIQENMPQGSEIKMINVSALIITDADVGENSMYNITLEDNSVFTISPSQGDGSTTCTITVANSSVLDYEQHQNFTIKVIATALKTSQNESAVITVFVSNINDNFPKFNQSSYEAHIHENAPFGYTITTLEASDADFGDFGIVHYFIDGAQTWFRIDNAGQVILNTTEKLDRETKDSYTITVKARDNDGFEGSTQLTIRVTDQNDEYPKFEILIYSAEVKEMDTVFRVPLIVKAKDDDEPGTNNSKISYSITHSPTEFFSSQFKINDRTGEITLSSNAPDYENLTHVNSDRVLQLQVTATDWGNPPLNTSALVNVTVTDINDETPEFGQSTYTGNVPENATTGESIVTVTARDNDGTGPNNETYYAILSGSRDKLQINSATGLISVGIGAKLDRETTDKYGFNLTVLAIDKGSPALTGTTAVFIQVEDVNDSPPIITPVTAVFPVYENASKGHEIVKFNATDEDEDHNLKFTVLFAESRAYDEKDREVNASLIKDWLNIDSVQGILTVRSEMDREQVEQIILKVVVADSNAVTQDQEATATVTVSLLDVNDNPPEISSEGGVLYLNVSEGSKFGTEVNTLSATDADKRQTVTFTLANADSFDITKSGILKLAKSLDRESKNNLTFKVIATDSGSPSLSSNISVLVTVLDINDNDPVFDDKQTTFSVLECSNNTLVTTITAKDIDVGDNGNVTFEFKDISPFRIDSTTGQIYVAGDLDRETTPIYTLTVIAMDNPVLESRRRASIGIKINIEDINDNDPVFQSNNYQGIVPETASNGSTVTITPSPISATDKDLGNNSTITFSFAESELDFFSINASTGEVFVSESIRGYPGHYSFVVNASDHGDPARHTQVNLTITILDENINDPIFVNLIETLQIPECAVGDRSIYTFNATDADADKKTNGKVQYYLDDGAGMGSNISQFFDLDKDLGLLTTKRTASSGTLFDKEKLSEVVIQVIAKDSGLPQRSAQSGRIVIKITDINDNPPEFIPGINTNFTVQEGRSSVRVGSVKAFDKDESSNLHYELIDVEAPWKDYFYITTDLLDGGVIYVNKPLDRERVSHIKLKVRANDLSTVDDHDMCDKQANYADINSAPLDLTVFVDDINDNPPVFGEKSMSVGFLSSTKFGEKIINLQGHVKDNDTAPNSIHGFYQMGAMQADSDISRTWTHDVKPDPIRIDLNGTISTNYKFSEDAYGFFRLQVQVNDSAGNDMLDLKIYVVGESQVIHITLWYTEDELRTFQGDLTRELSHIGYQFVPDNILPAYADDGSIDNSKSVLVTHAVDSEDNIVSGKTLVNKLDSSPLAAEVKNRYKIYHTESGDEAGKHAADTSAETIKFILIGIIGIVVLTFAITLTLLIHTIHRFKRKLTAATLEVDAISPAKPDIFPGLDNENIKSANPMFMRDDLIPEENKYMDELHQYNSDILSNASQNSLDQNTIGRERAGTAIDEQEVTLDMYEHGEPEQDLSNLYSHLHFRHSDTLQQNGRPPYTESEQRSSDVDSNEDLDEFVNVNLSNFESTDI